MVKKKTERKQREKTLKNHISTTNTTFTGLEKPDSDDEPVGGDGEITVYSLLCAP